RPELAELPQIIVFTKMDLPTARERWPALQAGAQAAEIPAFAISAPTREGLADLINYTAEQLRELPLRTLPEIAAAGLGPNGGVTLRPSDDLSFTITHEDGTYVVRGKRVERLASMTNPESEEGLARLEKQMRKLGVFEALEKEGIQPGDMMRFGTTVELEWGEG
ncbi:MAG TPA: Obg family GTPase CgtA, partial [Ktedonobacterales bacterium]|nr:Obg family GTPase CgtA [Ktedonobacterales bacterium]